MIQEHDVNFWLDAEFEAGYRKGMADAVRWLAISRDGGQWVGVKEEPIKDVIESIRSTPLRKLRTDGW